MKTSPKIYFEKAVQNVVRYGDTDIFPFPIENHILFDRQKEVVALLRQAYSYFDKCFIQFPPSNISTLSPVGPTGFRWATQQDPFWNAFLLGITLSAASEIEAARIPLAKRAVFSYRLGVDLPDGQIFRGDVSWRDFVSHSIEIAKTAKFVVLCDIGLLNLELAKTRVHGAVAKKLVSAVRHLQPEVRENAVLTLIDNMDNLYSLFPVVAITIKACFTSLSVSAQNAICAALRERIIKGSYIFGVELHAAYASRILGEQKNSENEDVLVTLYNRFKTPLVRRDIILIMAKWKHFHWLSDQINDYSGASSWERHSFIIASYFKPAASRQINS